MNYFSWIKLISVLIHLKYEQSFPVSLTISVKFYLRPLKPFFVLPHSTTSHRKYCIYQTICKSKQIKFIRKLLQIIIPYGSNTFLRAASLSKLDNMVNNTSLSSVQSMLNFLQNGRYSFIFTVQLVHTTNGKSPPKICLSTPVNFHLSITPLLVHKVILTIPTTSPFLYTLAISHLPLFDCNRPNNLH